jgi:methionyl-tRNA formyltransferase
VRVVYLGTPAAAVPPLAALLASAHEVVAVVTRPDRPRDRRGGTPLPSPVKQAAQAAGLPVLEPPGGRDPDLPRLLAETGAEIGVACAFGYLLPGPVLAALPRGIINLHFSLLPAYRGAAPVQRALLDGAEVTGVTTFVIDAGMDTGPTLLAAEVRVDPEEDAGALTTRLAEVGGRLVVETLDAIATGQVEPRPQPATGASVAPKVTGEEARLDFSWPARRLADAVRAFTPAPGAWTTHRGRRLKVTRAAAAGTTDLGPGRLAVDNDGHLLVGAADGALELLELRPEGRKAMSGAEFARGARLGPDERLGQ